MLINNITNILIYYKLNDLENKSLLLLNSLCTVRVASLNKLATLFMFVYVNQSVVWCEKCGGWFVMYACVNVCV